jgi:hypothetical protein
MSFQAPSGVAGLRGFTGGNPAGVLHDAEYLFIGKVYRFNTGQIGKTVGGVCLGGSVEVDDLENTGAGPGANELDLVLMGANLNTYAVCNAFTLGLNHPTGKAANSIVRGSGFAMNVDADVDVYLALSVPPGNAATFTWKNLRAQMVCMLP